LISGGGRPDIEFYIKGERYILDVVYARDFVLEHAFNDKINKYQGKYCPAERIIPFVVRHNGMIYTKSLELIKKFLPELNTAFIHKTCCHATIKHQEKAKVDYTDRIK